MKNITFKSAVFHAQNKLIAKKITDKENERGKEQVVF